MAVSLIARADSQFHQQTVNLMLSRMKKKKERDYISSSFCLVERNDDEFVAVHLSLSR